MSSETAPDLRDEPRELRYRDGPNTQVAVFIDAPPEEVWAVVTDIELPARFSSELQSARWLDDATGPQIGARFYGRNHHDAVGEWETVCIVTELETQRVFGYVVNDVDQPAAAWRFTLEPDGSGTRLTQWMRIGPGPSGISVEIDVAPDNESRILHRRLGEHQANMRATLDGIKAIVES